MHRSCAQDGPGQNRRMCIVPFARGRRWHLQPAASTLDILETDVLSSCACGSSSPSSAAGWTSAASSPR
eukprot:981213-Pyramimonas_sp.AAC.1